MQDIILKLIGLGFLGLAIWLVHRQLQLWKVIRACKPEKPSLQVRFGTSQCRRRIQCSAMLGVLGIGMIVESWITDLVARAVLGAAMLIVLGWMILLAFFDILAIAGHYRRMSSRFESEQIQLEAKAKKILYDGENSGTEEDR